MTQHVDHIVTLARCAVLAVASNLVTASVDSRNACVPFDVLSRLATIRRAQCFRVRGSVGDAFAYVGVVIA